MRISDWSSDVCSSDLIGSIACDHFQRLRLEAIAAKAEHRFREIFAERLQYGVFVGMGSRCSEDGLAFAILLFEIAPSKRINRFEELFAVDVMVSQEAVDEEINCDTALVRNRSEEHTSELQSLMRISYAVF